MAIQSPLVGTNTINKTQLNAFLKDLKNEPENVQKSELTKLTQAGAARLPDDALSTIADAIFALTADQYDPANGKPSRPAPPSVDAGESRIEQERSMDGVGVDNTIKLFVEGKAAPNATVELLNMSRENEPRVATAKADDKGNYTLNLQRDIFHGDVIGVRVRDEKGAMSDVVPLRPKSVEVRKWQSGTTRRHDVETKDARSPLLSTRRVTHEALKPHENGGKHGMVLAGAKNAAEPMSNLEVMLDNKVVGKGKVLEDGSFMLKANGLTPGQAVELRVIDPAGQVSQQNYSVPPLHFDTNALTASTQGVPYDKLKNGQVNSKGPFLRFAAANVGEPGSTVLIKNNSTGKEHTAKVADDGSVDVEIPGVHQGDSLAFAMKDQAGHVANDTIDNWVVPGNGEDDPDFHRLIVGTTLLTPQVDELISILKDKPTSVHRASVESFLAGDADKVIKNPADKTKLANALKATFSGDNDIRTNANNPAPKDPIVIGARVIKPRIMDQGDTRGLDPIEVEGKAEPFSTVEFFNASRPGAPSLGRVQADKDGNFKFINRDERLFLHGDQVIARATDQGGATSGDSLTTTHAYELQVWRQTGRQELVDLPHGTDTRDPFIDQKKITKSEREPIGRRGKTQVFAMEGGAHAVPPHSILRVTTAAGDIFEAKAKQDGSFKFDVGKFVPGETLQMHIIDINGRTTMHNVATEPLKFDSETFTSSSQGVPYQRFTNGKPDENGPFLSFKSEGVVDPYSWVEVKNNSTGETFKVQANAKGDVEADLKRTHAGDSLAFTVTDPAGNVAPNAIENYVVPSERAISDRMLDIECQKLFLPEHITELETIVLADPSAVHRAVLESVLSDKDKFKNPADYTRLRKFTDDCFGPSNDIRVHAENPAPKEPIVISAEVIKPREMEPRPQPTRTRPNPPRNNWRDPLIIKGKAEPFSTIEVRNMSRPNSPVIGTVQTDKDGNFDFESTDESRFLHGDQVVLRATDQGGATSKPKLTDTVPYEMRLWHNPPRSERVKLPIDTNTRAPFVDLKRVTQEPKPATAKMKEQVYNIDGGELAAEPNSIVRVTNKAGKEFETKVAEDGSFKLPVVFEPGETLTMRLFDIHGAETSQNLQTKPLKFDGEALTDSTEGAPFDVNGAKGGPFLDFKREAVVDPFSILKVRNNSTGQEMKIQADENGNIDFRLGGVHQGDSLSFSVKDPAGNEAQGKIENYVVPAGPRATTVTSEITAMHLLQPEHTQRLINDLKENPTAANRGTVEKWLADDANAGAPNFQVAGDRKKIEDALKSIFRGPNDVTTNLNNPAPKEPIVLEAKVIKPRVMDQGSAAGRDPLEVSGEAEPFSTVEIRNASRPNAPVIGTAVADANGEFNFLSTDERLFLHGDQLLVKTTDQGGASSTPALATTRAYELRIWNRENRTETVRLSDTVDTRDPFLDTKKLEQTQTVATKKKPDTFTSFAGGPLSAPPNAIVRVTTSKGEYSETQVQKDGSFKLDVSDYVPGETLTATVTDINGRSVQHNFSTQALKFEANRLTDPVGGPPYQKMSGGKTVSGGPFLEFKADEAAFPGAVLTVTNHSTGSVSEFVADDKGGFDFELGGVHAHDLLTFEVADAAGNPAPNQLKAWQVPVESSGPTDPTIQALTSQRPVSAAAVKHLVAALEAQPTMHHRVLVENLLHQHEDWFTNGSAKKLEDELARIFAGPTQRIPDTSNPKPEMPVVLSSEIRQVRVMDSGNAPAETPVSVAGFAEPLSTIEIFNGSMPGRPRIGSVQVGEDGKFEFKANDTRNFQHGDQLVVQAKDAGGAQSDAVVSRASAIEVRVWNQSGTKRRHNIDSDRRQTFLAANKVSVEKADGRSKTSFVLVGDAAATEVFGKVSVTIGNDTFETEADIDGRFRLPIKGAEVGEQVVVVAADSSGREVRQTITIAI